MFLFHGPAFQKCLIHAENIGGDTKMMLNKRGLVGAVPWRCEGLQASPVRILRIEKAGDQVPARGYVAKAIFTRGGR